MTSKALAFLKKDLLMESSYKTSFLLNFFGILVSILGYYFINELFGRKLVPHLEQYGTDYFSYVLLSSAFFGYAGVGLGSFSERIRTEQQQGTLEAVILTPTTISTILTSLALWNLMLATVDLIIYALLGIFLFKIDFSSVNLISTALVFILTITSFSAIGMISACFIMIFKRGNPFGWILGSIEGLIGGVYFPVTVLPAWMQMIAAFFPITHAIRAVQLAVYKGYPPERLWKELTLLCLFSCLLFPLALVFFRYSLRKARKDGTLGQY